MRNLLLGSLLLFAGALAQAHEAVENHPPAGTGAERPWDPIPAFGVAHAGEVYVRASQSGPWQEVWFRPIHGVGEGQARPGS